MAAVELNAETAGSVRVVMRIPVSDHLQTTKYDPKTQMLKHRLRYGRIKGMKVKNEVCH